MAATALFLLLAATASPAPSVCDRSVAYILQGRYDAALQQLEGAKTSGASPAGVENLRGLAFLLEGDLSKALSSFDRALQLDPAMSEARLNRGIARLRAGRLLDASDDLQTVTNDEHSALRGDAAYHNAIVLDRLHREDDAEQWLERAMKLDPKLDAALLYLGLLRERRGKLQEAGRAYLDYLALHPDSVMALLRFGVSAQKAGRADVAKSYLQRVIALDPGSAEATEARKYLVMWE